MYWRKSTPVASISRVQQGWEAWQLHPTASTTTHHPTHTLTPDTAATPQTPTVALYRARERMLVVFLMVAKGMAGGLLMLGMMRGMTGEGRWVAQGTGDRRIMTQEGLVNWPAAATAASLCLRRIMYVIIASWSRAFIFGRQAGAR